MGKGRNKRSFFTKKGRKPKEITEGMVQIFRNGEWIEVPASALGLTDDDDYERYKDRDLKKWWAPPSTRPIGAPPPKPVIDQAKVDAAIAALVPVVVGVPETFTAPITYVVAKNGIFVVRKSPLGAAIAEVKEIPAAKGELRPGFAPSVPKLPMATLRQIVSFFRACNVKAKRATEAYVQVWYMGDGNGRTWWEVVVPEQEVGPASVRHNGHGREVGANAIHVFDIHSHGGMGAFFSGVDDADEKVQGMRIFGVVGKTDTKKPEFRWRIGKGDGTFLDVHSPDVIAPEDVPVTINAADLLDGPDFQVSFSLWAEDVAFPPEWLARVDTDPYGARNASGRWERRDGYQQPQGMFYNNSQPPPKRLLTEGPPLIHSVDGTYAIDTKMGRITHVLREGD